MWLGAVESGHDRVTRTVLGGIRRSSRMEPPAVLKLLFYRHRFFGTPLSDMFQQSLRGPSFWTVAEREIFATATSEANECPFCYSAHHAIAGAYIDIGVVDSALTGNGDSPLRPEAQAMIEFLRRMTRDPDGLTPADADKVRQAGVSAEAFEEAVWVGTFFNVINRMLNTFGAPALDERGSRVGARFIKSFGYRVPAPIRLFSRGT
ncbi:carboxymuconolactone decarboxylase family protein [Nocardia brasiliensis]|uniref:carboxymuconolactone decarboxylase family protein n=1 Tax=Nocardia brasiliensis TaxID=37326 RepID=UPI0033EA2A7D